MPRVYIELLSKEKKSVKTGIEVSKKAQVSYKKLCKEKKIKYKFLRDFPRIYRSYEWSIEAHL